jgi:phenylalanyl-tRNA synthetase alpha chain
MAAKFTPIDVSRPGKPLYKESRTGHMHPSSLVLKETYRVFTELGFAIVDSPEIEDDWHNFEALNMPEIHPAREMQDTFYIDKSNKKLLPRTHTSGMQVRFMKQNNPPFKIIVPGKVFRNENEDATHSWTFGQIEGLVVGEGVSVTDLRGTLLEIVKKQLGPETEIRFRASYFPYTEPSMEVDAKFKGKWLELGGAGMVHPQVLINGGIDPEKYSGFAFGWGVERLAVIKYGITDLRELWRPKFDYLEQF